MRASTTSRPNAPSCRRSRSSWMRTTPARCSAWSRPSKTLTMSRTSSPITQSPTTSWNSSGDLLSGVDVRQLRPDDDVEAELDLTRRAFGPISPARRAARVATIQQTIENGAIIGAFDGGRLVGSARYHIMRQWWHGRQLPMAGVAGVKVAPEERGRGVGTAMTSALLDGIAERG